MTPFWTFITIIASMCGILGFGWLIIDKIFVLRKWFQNRQLLKRNQTPENPLYINGLSKSLPRKKTILLNEALLAQENYKYEEAIAKFKVLLGQETDDNERCALLNLIGLSQKISGKTKDAERTFLGMIVIAKNANLDEALAIGLGNLGNVYLVLDDLHKALMYYQKALVQDKAIGNQELQAGHLGNVGIVYGRMVDLEKALKCHQNALEIAERIYSLEIQAIQLANLGGVYLMKGNYQEAVELLQKAFRINKRIGRVEGMALNLGNIGFAYQELEDFSKALEFHLKSLEMNIKIGNLEGQGINYFNIGRVYLVLEQFEEALSYFERAREKFEGIEAKHRLKELEEMMISTTRAIEFKGGI